MAESLGPIDIDSCDSPSYMIVQACRLVGFNTPEDVRWYRHSRFVHRGYENQDIVNIQKWRTLLGLAGSRIATCTCGQKLPALERYTFTLTSGREVDYLLSQCTRCRTIFWDET